MTLGIFRTHAVIFPISYQDTNIFFEIDETSDYKVRIAVSNYLSFWVDDLLTHQNSINGLTPFSRS